MLKFFKYIKLFLEMIRCFPHILIFLFHPKRQIIKLDNLRWLEILGEKEQGIMGLLHLLSFYPEYRNLFYKRIGILGSLLTIICPKLSSLYIATDDIGPGLFIQHGFSTIIAAESIGKNCWINQQVTIGYGTNRGCPVIMDNVQITAGAKVFNAITVGENSKIGSNAVVTKNVPSNATVIGIPAYIIKLDGVKTNIPL